MKYLKSLLTIILWFVMVGTLLTLLTLGGTYLYYAIPMQKRFAKLEITQSTDCTTSQRWQIIAAPEDYPPRLRTMLKQTEKYASTYPARLLLEDGLHGLAFQLQWVIAELEFRRHYTAEKRLEIAMNHFYMGMISGCSIIGINTASQAYFGKAPVKLSPAEMALLVGMVKGASYYHPFRNAERTLKRRNQVLETARTNGLLTEAEYQTALNEPLPAKPYMP